MNGEPVIPPADPAFHFGETHLMSVGPYGSQNRREIKVSIPARKPSKKRPPLVEPEAVTHRVLRPGVGPLKVPFFSGAFGIRFFKVLVQIGDETQFGWAPQFD
jgi:hypothetical protein